MTQEQFVYWLQGFFELNHDGQPLTKREQMIKDHLKTVFHKVTPNYPGLLGAQPTPALPQPFPPGTIIC